MKTDSTSCKGGTTTDLPITERKRIVVVPWNDDRAKALAGATVAYPDHEVTVVDKRRLRENGLLGQLRALRQFRGMALVVYFRSLDDLTAPLLLAWTAVLHRCNSTVLLDEAGNMKVYGRWIWLRIAPITAIAVMLDAVSLLHSLFALQLGVRRGHEPVITSLTPSDAEIAYLFPFPMSRFEVGGAMSHVRGVLGGFKKAGVRCNIFTGRPLSVDGLAEECISLSRRPCLFWEARAIAYNWRFAKAMRAALKDRRPTSLYQRHGRFVVAGALVARALALPLIIEYNGSEVWMAQNWNPAYFKRWLRLCEEYALRSASVIAVVSEPLRQELLARGVPKARILVNPNGVDPTTFQPGLGGSTVRTQVGLAADKLVVCFVGTFSYWHGVNVLQEAISRLLENEEEQGFGKLAFLLIGDGPLRGDAASHLKPWVDNGRVIFTGVVPHDRVPGYLDAADIFLSPQIPFADGSEFFGSPSKLFEYMAMGKAIVASNLGQISQVLSHGENGWLVTPGSVDELVGAITHLVKHPEIRARLGSRARETVLSRYTWQQNAQAVLDALRSNVKSERQPFSAPNGSESARSAP